MAKNSELHQQNLEKIFYPKSIAIVGANRVKGTVPCDILTGILKADFQGVMYPVSPREKYISSIKAYKYVTDIPDPVDLAVLVFPSSVCHLALEQCGQMGIKAAIIISAGFKEVGGVGMEREKQIKEIADTYDISFIGPNCLGVINTDPQTLLNASFARKMPEEGSIAFLSQSGALCTAVLDYARAKHIGFSKFVSFGNKADISDIDLLYYLCDDPKTKVILMYLEEVTDGCALMKAARDVISRSGKPILILKSGRTSAGASAAASHTGSLAGSDEVCNAGFEQAGIQRCNNIEEMFNTAIALAYQPLPANNRIAIVTNAGGPGVLTTDASINEGLELAAFSEETTKILKKWLPATANIKNPVDVIGDARADRYNVAVSAAMKDGAVDGVFVILTPQSMTDIETIAREICKVALQFDKPLYASFMGEADVSAGIEILQKHKIPHYFLPESMGKAFASAYQFHKIVKQGPFEYATFTDIEKEKALSIIEQAVNEKRSYLPENEAVKVLEAYGFPVPANATATSIEEIPEIMDTIGFPAVMKVVSDHVVHKSDMKGVFLNINSVKEAEKAYSSIQKNLKHFKPDAEMKGVYITRMITKGDEVILGVKRDNSFGPVIMFGLGGVFVEIFKDVSFRVAPVDRENASSMISQINGEDILKGVRGRTPSDIENIQECVLRLSQLAMDCPHLRELDINPLIVLEKGKGCFIADAKIML
jgi:acetyltransferase